MSYFLSYVIGWREPSGKKATLGSMVHKALECLARQKLAMQRGEPTFTDDEMKRTFQVDGFHPDQAIRLAFELYSEKETHHEWFSKDLKQVRQWMWDAMELNGGRWNPLNRDVVMPEQYFDMAIEKDWARYSYAMPDGSKLEGHLAIKGTVDLITKVDSNTLEYVDWKSGMRKDWATGEPKGWRKLRDDPQLRMYHYALSKLYPQYEHIIMTIVFIQDGGAFPLDFGPQDLPKTEQMLKERFETIKGCRRPPRILRDPTHNWKCKRLCHYGRNNMEGSDKTICNHVYDEVVELGMDRVVAKYAKDGAWGQYGSGGGSSNRDEPKTD